MQIDNRIAALRRYYLLAICGVVIEELKNLDISVRIHTMSVTAVEI